MTILVFFFAVQIGAAFLSPLLSKSNWRNARRRRGAPRALDSASLVLGTLQWADPHVWRGNGRGRDPCGAALHCPAAASHTEAATGRSRRARQQRACLLCEAPSVSLPPLFLKISWIIHLCAPPPLHAVVVNWEANRILTPWAAPTFWALGPVM
jgi:hypothetical protein